MQMSRDVEMFIVVKMFMKTLAPFCVRNHPLLTI